MKSLGAGCKTGNKIFLDIWVFLIPLDQLLAFSTKFPRELYFLHMLLDYMLSSSLFPPFLGCGLTKCVLFERVKIDISEILLVLGLLNLNWSRRFSALRFAARQKKSVLLFAFICKSNLKNVDGDLKAAVYFYWPKISMQNVIAY